MNMGAHINKDEHVIAIIFSIFQHRNKKCINTYIHHSKKTYEIKCISNNAQHISCINNVLCT